MTRDILNKIAKAHKINLNWYTHVHSWLNDNATYITVEFSNLEVINGYRRFYDVNSFRLRFIDILKREDSSFDYFTDGIEWISDIK